MIKVSKHPKKYANSIKVSGLLIGDVTFVKNEIKKNKLYKLPKNTLKIVKGKLTIGRDGDDLAKDLWTIKSEYLVYTFRR